MTPYSATERYKLQKFLSEKFVSITSSKDFELACTDINQYPALLADKLLEKFIPFGFPELLEEAKTVKICPKTIGKSVLSFPNNSIKVSLNEQASHSSYQRAIVAAKETDRAMKDWRGLPSYSHLHESLVQFDDHLVYEYKAYQVVLPISGSHELALCLVSNTWSITPGQPICELKINSGNGVEGKHIKINNVFAEIELCWPLPGNIADLSTQQVESLKNQLSESIIILKHSFNSARKDFMEWEDSSKNKLKEIIRGYHGTRRLELQRIANENSRYKDVLDKLLDI